MLSVKWFIFFFFAFSLGALISGVMEQSYLGAGDASTVAPFFDTYGQVTSGNFGSIISLAFNFDTYESLWNMFWWNYTGIFTGSWVLVQYFLIATISAGMAISFVILLAQSLPIIGSGG